MCRADCWRVRVLALSALRGRWRHVVGDRSRFSIERRSRRSRSSRSPGSSLARAGRRRTGPLGCRALIDQLYGVGELTEFSILAELGDARRCQLPDSCATAWISPSTDPTLTRARAPFPPRTTRAALGAVLSRAAPRFPASPDRASYQQLAGGSAATARAARSRAVLGNEQLPPPQSPRRPGARAHHLTADPLVARHAQNHPMNRGQLPAKSLPTLPGDGPERMSGRTTSAGTPHHTSCRRPGANPSRAPK